VDVVVDRKRRRRKARRVLRDAIVAGYFGNFDQERVWFIGLLISET